MQRRDRRVFCVRFWGVAPLVAFGVLLAGCASQTPAPVFGWDEAAPAPEGHYRVKAGDTLSDVAERLKIDVTKLARWNDLKPPYKIVSGRVLRITPPGEGAAAPVLADSQGDAKAPGVRTKDAAEKTKPKPSEGNAGGDAKDAGGLRWQWPLQGPVRQRFVRGDRTRAGIRIAGHAGDRVRAAAAGTVVYSGSGLKGYGNLIIIQHNKTYLSAYGFNRRLLVHEGERVKRGQVISEIGQTAGEGWLLHFEIRRNGNAVDPLGRLPSAT